MFFAMVSNATQCHSGQWQSVFGLDVDFWSGLGREGAVGARGASPFEVVNNEDTRHEKQHIPILFGSASRPL